MLFFAFLPSFLFFDPGMFSLLRADSSAHDSSAPLQQVRVFFVPFVVCISELLLFYLLYIFRI